MRWLCCLGATAVALTACANGGPDLSGWVPSPDSDAATSDSTAPPSGSADASSADGASFGDGLVPMQTLAVEPANPELTVSVADGVVTSPPVIFGALANGSTPVTATWQIDRPELGDVDSSTGLFTPSGSATGVGHVTARIGSLSATTRVAVTVVVTQNGAPNGKVGTGNTGVGGNGFGGPVSGDMQTSLASQATPPTSTAQFGWLYPYDKTVWPRGLLPPLLQWQTNLRATAVYVRLTQKYFEFRGFYSGSALLNQPIDPSAWTTATRSNLGDPLHVDLVISDGSATVGPISEQWTIASAALHGTVYYDSYDTSLAPSGVGGAVLAIKPGAPQPQLALPAAATKCVVCHEISADGATLFGAYSGTTLAYTDGASWNLKNGGAEIASYSGAASPGGYSNDHKFVWSAPYPDGTFAMASSNYVRESYFGDSHLFGRAAGNPIPAAGWDGVVTQAAMPAFSTDGKMLAFNFWTGATTNGVSAGQGHSLAVMDFSCGAPDGGVGCGTPPYAFSNLREVYRDTTGASYVGWPQFLPGSPWLVFHKSLKWSTGKWAGNSDNCTAMPTPNTTANCVFSTWEGAQAELWAVDVPAAPGPTTPVALDQLNGKGYLPTNADHPSDAVLNYEPTVNPIPSGGYYWVVFTSRRMYGNVLPGDPYSGQPTPKKLWAAAVDLHPSPGKDPSHPAFYLPGQELGAGNMRGHWVVDPCKANGGACASGDECCNGYCRQAGDAAGLSCTDRPSGCAQLYERCGSTGDCCQTAAGVQCVNGYCTNPSPM
jgi:hypothetical protein